jgi:LuxR family transcriptional regulator, maltose regulon positive regulatory protein
MSSRPHDRVPAVADPLSSDFNEALRLAKLDAPRTRPGTIGRPRLVAALRGVASVPLVVISAPIGSGKATLLSEWADHDPRTLVWVSLERGDGGPIPLFTLVATALERVRPSDPVLWTDLRSPGVSVLGRIAPRLVAVIRSPGEPFVLVLRNLHEVRSRLSRDALDLLVDHLPAGVQVVAVSDQSVWMTTAVRRSRGDLALFGPSDLAFDSDEAQRLFQASGLGITANDVERLVDLTEGWAAGLQLHALALRPGRTSALLRGVPSPHPFLSDYVRAAVLAQMPRETLQFLRRTAVLDVMSGPLCDATLDTTGSAQNLAAISQTNLFVVPFDDQQDWYRTHTVFRAVLLDELLRREPDLVPELHRRAADWWEANGSVDRTITHARASGDLDRAAQLLTQQILPAYLSGRLPLAKTWLEELGESTIARTPELAVLAGLIALLDGRPLDAMRWADLVSSAAREGSDQPERFTSLSAILRAAMCPDGVAAMAADAEVAMKIEPMWSVWRTYAVGALALARWLDGADEEAEGLLGDAIAAAEAAGAMVPRARWLAHRAVLLMDRDEWSRAAEDVNLACAIIEDAGLTQYGAVALAYTASARLLLHRQEADAAREPLAHAMLLRPLVTWAMPWSAVLVRLELADGHLALADAGTAVILLREIDDVLHHRRELGILVERVERLRDRLHHVQEAHNVSTLTAAELRLLPYLQTHLTLQEIGERLFVSRNTVSSQTGSIYRKLGVTSRGDAVTRARDLGLLAPTTLA